MGAWGSGLYSSDFALDMRGAVKAVARLRSRRTGCSNIYARQNPRRQTIRRMRITRFSGSPSPINSPSVELIAPTPAIGLWPGNAPRKDGRLDIQPVSQRGRYPSAYGCSAQMRFEH